MDDQVCYKGALKLEKLMQDLGPFLHFLSCQTLAWSTLLSTSIPSALRPWIVGP